MKNPTEPNDRSPKWPIIVLFIFPIFGIILVCVTGQLFFKDIEVRANYSNNMYILLAIVYLIVTIISLKKLQKSLDNAYEKKLDRARRDLSAEFKTVGLNSSNDISKDVFKCQAKVDEDGKIICRIQVDVEKRIENYEEFLRYFHFPDEE